MNSRSDSNVNHNRKRCRPEKVPRTGKDWKRCRGPFHIIFTFRCQPMEAKLSNLQRTLNQGDSPNAAQDPRRSFLLAWLGSLLAGWLGRSQTHAAPTPPLPPPAGSLSISDPHGQVTTYVYDADGRLLQSFESGHLTTYAYDDTNSE